MWKLVFNVIYVIFKFGSPKRKTHKVHMNNASCEAFKKYALEIKKMKFFYIVTDMDLWKYDKILAIQKSFTIKQLRFSKNRFLIWIYHLILYYVHMA
jgi:hypothetical protein